MVSIPAKVKERIVLNVRKFQKILANAKNNDVNEADTVAIIKDMLNEVFGYEKYSEITSEYAVKKTFCDLAIKKDGSPYILMEVKAVGIDLKDTHTKQALDYGANAGIDWIILSNGIIWKVYKVVFSKPIETELVYEFDMLTLNLRRDAELEMLYFLCKEATSKAKAKGLLDDYHDQKQLISRYMLGQIICTEEILNAIKKYLKKISPDTKVDIEEIRTVIENEIIKREVFDSERSLDAKKRITKAAKAKPTKEAEPIVKCE